MGSLVGIFGFDTAVMVFVYLLRVMATGEAKSAQDVQKVSRPCLNLTKWSTTIL